MFSLFSFPQSFSHQSFLRIYRSRFRIVVSVSRLRLNFLMRLPIHCLAYEGVEEVASSSCHFTIALLQLIPAFPRDVQGFAKALRVKAARECSIGQTPRTLNRPQEKVKSKN
jgi:hypothetical protein